MSIFFKISDDGKSVFVAKSFTDRMDTDTFRKKAKEISVESFLNKFSDNNYKELKEKIETVSKINSMNLSYIELATISNPCSRTTSTCYSIDGKKFVEDTGENEEKHERKDALDYMKARYGNEFYNKFVSTIEKEQFCKICFSGNTKIEEKTYNKLKEEYDDCTKIVNLKEFLNNKKR